MRSHALSCVLVIQTRHQVIWCLRFTSLSKQASHKGKAEEKKNLLAFMQCMRDIFLMALGNE